MLNHVKIKNAIVLLTAGLFIGPAVLAQEQYPSKPVTVVVPFPPGGVADIAARALAPVLERDLKQSVIIVNKPGAGGSLGAGAVANAKPDGYTMLMALASISTNPEQERINKRPAPFQLNQLTPIARISMEQMMLAVRADSPYQDVKDIVADAMKRPGAVSYASSGIYGVYHVATDMFSHASQIKLNHIPYGGGAPALLALLSGDVDFGLVTRSVGVSHLQSGKLRPLAAWGAERWKDYPSVPTIKEAGYDVDYQLWSGLFVPAGTPLTVQKTLREAVRIAAGNEQFKKTLESQNASAAYMDAPEFDRYWKQDSERLIQAVQKIGVSQ